MTGVQGPGEYSLWASALARNLLGTVQPRLSALAGESTDTAPADQVELNSRLSECLSSVATNTETGARMPVEGVNPAALLQDIAEDGPPRSHRFSPYDDPKMTGRLAGGLTVIAQFDDGPPGLGQAAGAVEALSRSVSGVHREGVIEGGLAGLAKIARATGHRAALGALSFGGPPALLVGFLKDY